MTVDLSKLQAARKAANEDPAKASKLETYFRSRLESVNAVYIPYFSLGDPNMEASLDVCRAMLNSGADILELGIPFSDPIADGPVIQKAFSRALANDDVNFENCLAATGKLHQEFPDKPLVYLVYFNLIYNYGLEKMLKKCQEIGVRGLVIPDLPFDAPEGIELSTLGLEYDVDLIYLFTPQTTQKRRQAMGSVARGFVYYVSSYGVTGARSSLSEELPQWVATAKADIQCPLAVGFGINKEDQAKNISSFADGIIVGSANHRIIEENVENKAKFVQTMTDYTKGMADASHG